MCVYACMHACMHMCVCMHIYIYIYTDYNSVTVLTYMLILMLAMPQQQHRAGGEQGDKGHGLISCSMYTSHLYVYTYIYIYIHMYIYRYVYV